MQKIKSCNFTCQLTFDGLTLKEIVCLDTHYSDRASETDGLTILLFCNDRQ